MDIKSKYNITRDESHAYTVEYMGKTTILPGVTGILDIVGNKDKINRLMGWGKKQALLKVAEHLRAFIGEPLYVDEAWIEAVRKSAWKRDKELLKEAGDIGTKIHSAIDAYILGNPIILDNTTKPGFDNFLKWLEESKIKLIKGDSYVATLSFGYGGALDAIGERNGSLILLDWKTGSSLYDTAALQLAAYNLAFLETYGLSVDTGFVVRFGKDIPGDIEPKEVNIKSAEAAWINAVFLYKSMKIPLWKEN